MDSSALLKPFCELHADTTVIDLLVDSNQDKLNMKISHQSWILEYICLFDMLRNYQPVFQAGYHILHICKLWGVSVLYILLVPSNLLSFSVETS